MAIIILVGALLVLLAMPPSAAAQVNEHGEVEFPERILFSGLGAAVVALAAAAWIVRAYRKRRRARRGQSIPVTVYFGSHLRDRFPEPPSSMFQAGIWSMAAVQPLLLLVAPDGRMWTAQPAGGTEYMARYFRYRGNPWVLPLASLAAEGGVPRPWGQPPAPAGVGTPATLENQRVSDAIRALRGGYPGGPAPSQIDPGQYDPTYGGPVPGQLLLTPPDGHGQGGNGGLVLHRPAHAPVVGGLRRRHQIRYMFFGADPGICQGLYLDNIVPGPPNPQSWSFVPR